MKPLSELMSIPLQIPYISVTPDEYYLLLAAWALQGAVWSFRRRKFKEQAS